MTEGVTRRWFNKRLIPAAVVGTITAPVWLEETKREWGDRYNEENLKREIDLKIQELKHNFGITIATDVDNIVEHVQGIGKVKFTSLDSKYILLEFLKLIESKLWIFPPDAILGFVRCINIAYSLGSRDLNGTAGLGGREVPDSHKTVSLSVDIYLSGLFSFDGSISRTSFVTQNQRYTNTLYHEIGHRFTTRSLFQNWIQKFEGSGPFVKIDGRFRGPYEDIADFFAILFTSGRNLSFHSSKDKISVLRDYARDALSLDGDYWELLYSGQNSVEDWKKYWASKGRLRKPEGN